MSNTHHTKAIVLRTIKYGETSLIVNCFTELFGLQSYLINGIRTASGKKKGTAHPFQPAAILDLVVYHNELSNLQRIKEYRWSILYSNLYENVVKHSVGLYMIELLQKTLKQPEANANMFYFTEDALVHLDKSEPQVTANFPLFYALHLTVFLGFRFSDDYSSQNNILDLAEGQFIAERPHHPYILEAQNSYLTSQLLRVMQPNELAELSLTRTNRRELLIAYQQFYALHIEDFGTMRSLPILQEILG